MPMFNYGKALNRDWTAGTWRCMFLKGTWTPDIDIQFVSSIAGVESTGTGVVRKTLAGQTITVDTALDRADHYADNVTWTGVTCTDFRYLAVYKFTTSDADSVVLCYFDLGAQSVTATDVTVKWNAAVSNGVVFRGL